MKKSSTTFQRFDFFDNLELMHADAYEQDFPAHFHDQICLTLVQRGFEVTEVEGQQLINPVGNISFTYPEEIHANPNLNEGSYAFITYYLSPDVLNFYNKSASFAFKDRIVEDPVLYQYLYQWPFVKNKKEKEKAFQNIISYLSNKHIFPNKATEAPLSKILNLEEILAFIEANLDQKISLEHLANMAGLSKYVFLRAFKKAKGITPANYLILKRIEKAKRILRKGNAIVDACYRVGFFDQSHFHKYFKKYQGLTPLQYLNAK